jgi:hypothetical protein
LVGLQSPGTLSPWSILAVSWPIMGILVRLSLDINATVLNTATLHARGKQGGLFDSPGLYLILSESATGADCDGSDGPTIKVTTTTHRKQ